MCDIQKNHIFSYMQHKQKCSYGANYVLSYLASQLHARVRTITYTQEESNQELRRRNYYSSVTSYSVAR